jgi:hypothetical protein
MAGTPNQKILKKKYVKYLKSGKEPKMCIEAILQNLHGFSKTIRLKLSLKNLNMERRSF